MPAGHNGANAPRPRVLVLGGGFAGLGAARKLKDVDVDVVLVDKHDYHTFQRDLFQEQGNATVHQATVTGVDLDKREVQFAEIEPLAYDYLVLGLGAEVNFFGTDGAATHAFPMYTLADAVRLKEHLLQKWQAADRDSALIDDGALNVVVVGGGPTGVESAGALAELYYTNLAKDYPRIEREHARITLVEAAPELFGMFKPDIRSYTKRALEKRGVDLLLGDLDGAEHRLLDLVAQAPQLLRGKDLDVVVALGAGLDEPTGQGKAAGRLRAKAAAR